MKMYDVVLEKKSKERMQNDEKVEKTVLDSFYNDLEAIFFLRNEAYKTLVGLGRELLNNYAPLKCECECSETHVRLYGSSIYSNGPFEQYDYSIEERDVNESIPLVYIVIQETCINHHNETNILNVFMNKNKAEEYIKSIKQKMLITQNVELSKYNNDIIKYNDNDYIKFYIKYFYVE